MPYISQARREELNVGLGIPKMNGTGELNYVVHQVIAKYLKDIVAEQGPFRNGNNYQDFNDIIGVLGCVSAEFYRRKIAPYEVCKRTDNGDVEPYIKQSKRPRDGTSWEGCLCSPFQVEPNCLLHGSKKTNRPHDNGCSFFERGPCSCRPKQKSVPE